MSWGGERKGYLSLKKNKPDHYVFPPHSAREQVREVGRKGEGFVQRQRNMT